MTLQILYNLLRTAVVIAFTPFVEGIATRLKEVLQSKAGPNILHPYRDLSKLLHKDEVVPKQSSWLFRATPYVSFAAPALVALLNPVLTRHPLFFAFIGDTLGGGFILSLGGVLATLAVVDRKSLWADGREPNLDGRLSARADFHRRIPRREFPIRFESRFKRFCAPGLLRRAPNRSRSISALP